jgi:hypothetical protein
MVSIVTVSNWQKRPSQFTRSARFSLNASFNNRPISRLPNKLSPFLAAFTQMYLQWAITISLNTHDIRNLFCFRENRLNILPYGGPILNY